MPLLRRRSADSSSASAGPQVAPPDHSVDRGNAAMQDQMQSQGGPAEEGIGEAQDALDTYTNSAAVEVSGKLPGSLMLANHDGNEVTTNPDGVGFTIGVSRSGVYARFHPALEVNPAGFWARLATGGITISSLYYGFQEGKASASLDTGTMGDVLDWFFDLKDDIEAKLATGMKGALPARLQQPGFDPYTDPDLPALLTSVAGGLQGAFPSGGGSGAALLEQVTQPTLTARVSPKKMERDLGDKLKLVIDERASLALTAHFQGNMAEALDAPTIAKLGVTADNISIEHEIGGKLANVELQRLTFAPDLSVSGFTFDLGLESTLGALKALGMLFQLRTGQDIGIRDVQEPRLAGIRAMIDEKARATLPEMLREQITAHDDAIPGFKLSEMFDF